jgi:hypothetical protein
VKTIEEKKLVPAFPMQYYTQKSTETELPIYCLKDISKLTNSFRMFHKLNVAKSVKEELCKVFEVKTEV